MPHSTTSTLLTLVLTAAALTGCGAADTDDRAQPQATRPAPSCAPTPAADVRTVDGWLGWVAAHPDDVAVSLDDGRDRTVEHRADEPQPLASAVKAVHLAAYATAVRDGELDPEQPVRVSDWERWYLPGSDGGAHVRALQRLQVPVAGLRARDQAATVPLDGVVSAMIRESDNAAADLLLDLLGPQALTDAAADAGWEGFEPASLLGAFLRLVEPGTADERAAAQRYADDPAEAARVQRLPLPDPDAQARWAGTTLAGAAEDLAALHASLSRGELPEAREQLEWQPPAEGTLGVGFKGGSLPGVLSEAVSVRRADGTTAVGVLTVRGMAVADWAATLEAKLPHQQLLISALTDPAVADRLACALS